MRWVSLWNLQAPPPGRTELEHSTAIYPGIAIFSLPAALPYFSRPGFDRNCLGAYGKIKKGSQK
jgi:hypothetical protein